MSQDSPTPPDPSKYPTELSSGDQPESDPDATIIDESDFDSEVLRGMGDFFEQLRRFFRPRGLSSDSDSDSDSRIPPGSGSFERYKLIERVGQGGFGLVFRARDPVLGRDVALKIPRPEVLMTRSLRRRFLREARASAALDHPNIIHVHETGQVGPLCYIASAFCEGTTLSSWLDYVVDPIKAAKAARLIHTLALAVQHAHSRGVLHRDLKPLNILLQGDPNEHDLDKLVPRISDFGLAKIVDELGNDTRADVPVGSPPYMAPEQARGLAGEIGPASDIYALGAILYQLLTGRPPFRGESRSELLRQIVEVDPPAPRALRPRLERDLETICLKCLAKDPRRRYATAQELADDLGRFLRNEPVRARPIPPWEAAAKWCRRNPWKGVAVNLMFAATVGVAAAVVWRDSILRRHNEELQAALGLANSHADSTRRLLYDSQIRLAQQAVNSGDAEMAQEILDGLIPAPGEVDPRGFEWGYLDSVSRRDVTLLFDHKVKLPRLAISPDRRSLVAGDILGGLIFWDIGAERERTKLQAHRGPIDGLAFSPDGRTLASWAKIKKAVDKVRLWDVAARKPIASIQVPADAAVRDVRFSADGRTLAVRSRSGDRSRVSLWNLAPLPEPPTPAADPIEAELLAFSPDGRWMATAEPAAPGSLTLRDPNTRREIRTCSSGLGVAGDILFTRDGGRLLASMDRGLVIWETETGREIASFAGLPAGQLTLSPDGGRAALIAADGNSFCLLTDLPLRPRVCISRTTLAEWLGMLHAEFSPRGDILAIAGRTHSPTLWSTETGENLSQFPTKLSWEIGDMVFTGEGQSLIFTSKHGRARRWDFKSRRNAFTELSADRKEVWGVRFSPDGSVLATAGDDDLIRFWDPRRGTSTGSLAGHSALVSSVVFTPDGSRLASGSFDNTVRIWDARARKPLAVLRGHTAAVRSVAFSPDGRKIASTGSDRTVRLWDAETGRELFVFKGHRSTVHAVVFHPDGKSVVSADNDYFIKRIDAETGAELLALNGGKPVMALAFSPDGRTLAAADDSGEVTFWDTAAWTRRGSIKGSDAAVWGITFSPDGRTLTTAGDDAKVRLWDTATSQMTLELDGHAQRVNAVDFSPDGQTLASADHAGAIRLWHAGSPSDEPKPAR